MFTDNTLDPIEGVAVSLSRQGDTVAIHQAQTDAAGAYTFSAPAEKNLTVKFFHPAFNPAETDLFLTADTTLVTVMIPKNINIGEVVVNAHRQAFEIRNGKVIANIASCPDTRPKMLSEYSACCRGSLPIRTEPSCSTASLMLRSKRVLFSNVLTFESYTSSEVATTTTHYGTDDLWVTEHSRDLYRPPAGSSTTPT